jgi:hypothetical protein
MERIRKLRVSNLCHDTRGVACSFTTRTCEHGLTGTLENLKDRRRLGA